MPRGWRHPRGRACLGDAGPGSANTSRILERRVSRGDREIYLIGPAPPRSSPQVPPAFVPRTAMRHRSAAGGERPGLPLRKTTDIGDVANERIVTFFA